MTNSVEFVGSSKHPDDDIDEPLDLGNTIEDAEVPEPEPAAEPVPEPEPEAEPVPEPEPEAEPVPEPEPEPEPEPQPKKVLIPKARFDEVNERMRRAEAELKALKQHKELVLKSQPEAFDYDDAEQKYADAVVNGNLDEANRLRAEIRRAERAEAEFLARSNTVSTHESIASKASVDAAVLLINAEYPVFDPASTDYKQELVDEALDVFKGLIDSGKYTPAEALIRSAKVTAVLHDITGVKDEPESEPAPKPKKSNSVEQKIKAAKQQPPRVNQAGVANSKTPVDVTSISDKEFDSLPETVLRRLRGDYL